MSTRNVPSRTPIARPAAIVVTIALALTIVPAMRADAFKPYTHLDNGIGVLQDITPDGSVSIAGTSYPVHPDLITALREERCSYNAGLVGPDGFPDVVMGQSVIHPEQTGAWIDLTLTHAWQAQDDPRYTERDRRQILAYSYGFLTHAIGDMWVHTMVNDLARGSFPGVIDIATDPAATAIAIRHVLAEGYMADATPGFDGDPAYAALGADWTSDSTPGVCFEAPQGFIYDVFVNDDTQIPTRSEETERGVLLDTFYALRAGLSARAASLEQSATTLQGALDTFVQASSDLELVIRTCAEDFGGSDCRDLLGDLWDSGWELALAAFEAAVEFASQGLVRAYLEEWVADIDAGLRAWPEIGSAWTKAAFDPQTHRDMANYLCGTVQGLVEGTAPRETCESGVGLFDVLLAPANGIDNVDDFINEHMLSMLGLPDVVGDARATLNEIVLDVDVALAGLTGGFLNPIREDRAELKRFAVDMIEDAIKLVFGVDLEAIEGAFDSPTSKLDIIDTTLGDEVGAIWAPDDHARLDASLGIDDQDHHHPDVELLGPLWEHQRVSGPMRQGITFDPEAFRPFKNAVTLGKLALLDGAQLNEVLLDVLVRQGIVHADLDGGIQTYEPGDNVMVDGLDETVNGTRVQAEPWLRSIDGDHAWRADRLPRFNDGERAGTGRFPLWESCLARPAFRSLFDDWENPDSPIDFPALGDAPSADPTDPSPPTSTLTTSGTVYLAPDGTTWVGADHLVTHAAHDRVFADERIGLVHALVPAIEGGQGALTPTSNPGTFSLPTSPEGRWTVVYAAGDPCGDAARRTAPYGVDRTPPSVDTGGPYVVDEGSTVLLDSSSSSDAGAGIARRSWTSSDASLFPQNTQDPSFIPSDDGTHELTVTVVDHLGHSSQATTSLTIRNVAPRVAPITDHSITEGQTLEVSIAFEDPGADTHAATVTWGDGTTSSVSPSAIVTNGARGTASATHVYADDGAYPIHACVSDDDGGTGCVDATVSVVNAPPSVDIVQVGDDAFLLPHVDVPLVAEFLDPGTLDTHVASVNWGDGAVDDLGVIEQPSGPPGSSSGARGQAQGSHIFRQPGPMEIVVTVTDDDGGSGIARAPVEVTTTTDALEEEIQVLGDLAGTHTNPIVVQALRDALVDLDGAAPNANGGAIDKLADDDLVAALTKIGEAVEDLTLAASFDGNIGAARTVTLIAWSVSAEAVSEAERASDPGSRGDRRMIDRLHRLLDDGRQAIERAAWVDALDAFHEATRRAVDFVASRTS